MKYDEQFRLFMTRQILRTILFTRKSDRKTAERRYQIRPGTGSTNPTAILDNRMQVESAGVSGDVIMVWGTM